MKKNLLPLFAGIALLSACQEKGPDIDFGRARAFDTTYAVTTPEAPQAHHILIEEFTGVTCPNCPDGHSKIKEIEDAFPGKVIAIGYHPFGQGQSTPDAALSKYDFRTEDATEIGKNLGNVVYLPSGTIDRTESDGVVLDSRFNWMTNAAARIAVPTPVNLHVASEYTGNDREAVINVRAHFTSAVSKKLLIHIAILENDITDMQEYPNSKDVNYVHRHILRDIITPTAGSGVLDSMVTKQPGRVFERTVLYKLPEAWNAAKCRVVAFITSGEPGDLEVLQAEEATIE